MSTTDVMILVLVGCYGVMAGLWIMFGIIDMVEAFDRDDFKDGLFKVLLAPIWPIGGIIVLVVRWRNLDAP